MSLSTTHPSWEVRAKPSLQTCLCCAGGQGGAALPRRCWSPSRADGTSDCCSCVQRKSKGERVSGQRCRTGAAGIAPGRRGQACRARAQLSIAMGQHPASLPFGVRRGRMEPRVRCQLGAVGRKPRSKSRQKQRSLHLCKLEGRVLALSFAQLRCGQGSRQGKQFGFPFPSSTTRFWKHEQSSWHCCVPSGALL